MRFHLEFFTILREQLPKTRQIVCSSQINKEHYPTHRNSGLEKVPPPVYYICAHGFKQYMLHHVSSSVFLFDLFSTASGTLGGGGT